jgi:[protein-PII] uridylyltransferase
VNATTTPSELALRFKQARSGLLAVAPPLVRGRQLVDELTDLTFQFLESIAQRQTWPSGWALVATGGTGRRELCPGSDVDLLLLHAKKVPDKDLAAFGEALWYPLWDAGLSVTPGVHTVESATELGDREVLSAASWLDAVLVAGDQATFAALVESTTRSRLKHAKRQLRELLDVSGSRHERSGDVAFLLGPDLRDGHGGLRDLLVLRYIAATGLDGVSDALEQNPDALTRERDAVLAARAELHRCTGRPHDVLALQEQDAVAASLGLFAANEIPDADAMLAQVSSAARTIAWCYDETARRVAALLDRKRASRFGKALKLSADIALQSGEVVLADGVDPSADPSLLLRVGAAAALNKLPIARDTLQQLAQHAPRLDGLWPPRARHALVALLGAGPAAIDVIEALDHHNLIARVLPEWTTVRAKPQRNATVSPLIATWLRQRSTHQVWCVRWPVPICC